MNELSWLERRPDIELIAMGYTGHRDFECFRFDPGGRLIASYASYRERISGIARTAHAEFKISSQAKYSGKVEQRELQVEVDTRRRALFRTVTLPQARPRELVATYELGGKGDIARMIADKNVLALSPAGTLLSSGFRWCRISEPCDRVDTSTFERDASLNLRKRTNIRDGERSTEYFQVATNPKGDWIYRSMSTEPNARLDRARHVEIRFISYRP